MRPPYTCIYREIWDERRFWSLSEPAKLVYFYVLTTPLGNGIGCFKAGRAAMLEESRMLERTFLDGFDECCKAGLLEYDETDRVVWLKNYFKRNPPNNPNGLKSMAHDYVRVPDCKLKSKCYHTVMEWCKKKGGTFPATFEATFEEPCVEPSEVDRDRISPSPSPSSSLSLSLESSPAENPQGETAKKIAKKRPTKTGPVFDSYSDAYRSRYGVEPTRNQTVNSQLARFVDRVGANDAPAVAAFYVGSQNQWYVTKGHSVGVMLSDAEKLHTEWKTGRQVTSTQAREADRIDTQGQAVKSLIEQYEAEEREGNHEESRDCEVVGRSL
jgi:hypothetical protein